MTSRVVSRMRSRGVLRVGKYINDCGLASLSVRIRAQLRSLHPVDMPT